MVRTIQWVLALAAGVTMMWAVSQLVTCGLR